MECAKLDHPVTQMRDQLATTINLTPRCSVDSADSAAERHDADATNTLDARHQNKQQILACAQDENSVLRSLSIKPKPLRRAQELFDMGALRIEGDIGIGTGEQRLSN